VLAAALLPFVEFFLKSICYSSSKPCIHIDILLHTISSFTIVCSIIIISSSMHNFNAYVGKLPAPTTIDQLQPAGRAMLSKGLKVSCPANTLGATWTGSPMAIIGVWVRSREVSAI
jgi:hypothetical protein